MDLFYFSSNFSGGNQTIGSAFATFFGTIMQYPITCAIIANRYNNRQNGSNANPPLVDRNPIIQRLLAIGKELFTKIILVTDRPLAYLEKDVYMASGLYANRGLLEGIHAALFYADTPRVMIIYDDTPFLTADVIEVVLRYGHVDKEVIMPEIKNGTEPSLILLHQKCLPLLEKRMTQSDPGRMALLGKKRIHMIPEHLFRKVDPDLRAFITT